MGLFQQQAKEDGSIHLDKLKCKWNESFIKVDQLISGTLTVYFLTCTMGFNLENN